MWALRSCTDHSLHTTLIVKLHYWKCGVSHGLYWYVRIRITHENAGFQSITWHNILQCAVHLGVYIVSLLWWLWIQPITFQPCVVWCTNCGPISTTASFDHSTPNWWHHRLWFVQMAVGQLYSTELWSSGYFFIQSISSFLCHENKSRNQSNIAISSDVAV